MNPEQQIVLASSSPRRQELLACLGLPFRIQVSNVDETISEEIAPEEIVKILSHRKADAVAKNLSFGLVIGSDTIVVLDGQVLGKPHDEEDAFRMLTSLEGRKHEVYSGLAIIDVSTGKIAVDYSSTRVKMRTMTAEEIRGYIASKEPMDKAGSYAIQGLGSTIVERIEGDYFTVVGLPLNRLAQMLNQFGISLLNK
ncbi:Maf family protein [Brevibacillus laterosporus]|uniref:dTTP/UTP pyrophosphatase n=1 Tax=Brevibacillus laterosporus TaxID=1465 RepID=A0AAP8QD97_BRELA|nr:Maf family protein [Brevibacillus laterosporus]MED1664451.1 Maf family protein [Brevibacillus laterosporus]MED1668153.1 Maf family protein [Brevibacillus laterosporus]MED1719867.1 Maf family protein [Brevibacillus laterosporus]PPA89871.1 septum formation protein Maf [Brevibacillus laterosporus]PPB03172.1 septum formation protein Maf [Brevibacillus laterosporus]